MAEIPVQKKSGVPWWVWLILAALIAAVLIWIFTADDTAQDADVAATSADTEMQMSDPLTGNAEAADGSSEAFTDLGTLLAASQGDLTGRNVDLTDVEVESLEGDMSFYIGSDERNRMLVVFEQVPTPRTATEGRLDVNEGDRVSLVGMITEVGDLPEAVSTKLGDERVVILARQLSVENGSTLNPNEE